MRLFSPTATVWPGTTTTALSALPAFPGSIGLLETVGGGQWGLVFRYINKYKRLWVLDVARDLGGYEFPHHFGPFLVAALTNHITGYLAVKYAGSRSCVGVGVCVGFCSG